MVCIPSPPDLLLLTGIVGSVVRISPNELSFASVASWKAIYGHPATGKPTFPKSEFYDMYGSGYKSGCIGSERDPSSHGRMRKSLSAAFSTKALTEQEHIIQQSVDDFIRVIGAKGTTKALNMSDWFEMISFDILGEMAFGESFHCVENCWHCASFLDLVSWTDREIRRTSFLDGTHPETSFFHYTYGQPSTLCFSLNFGQIFTSTMDGLHQE